MNKNQNLEISLIIQEFMSGVYARDVTAHWVQEKQEAIYTDIPNDLHPALQSILEKQYPRGLFLHQKLSWDSVKDGKNVVISTGTSSGKSLCYYLPILNATLRNEGSNSLLLFPTKALTNDQLLKINQFINEIKNIQDSTYSPNTETYDGDTPESKRTAIRSSVNILLSNPDMLHLGILPHHTSWKPFLDNLKFIVIDEIHTYRGVFGSHFANVIRRLRRILEFYDSFPQYILTSATISNPKSFAENLIGGNVEIIDIDSSPKEERHYFFLNPPLIDKELGLRQGMVDKSVEIAALHFRNNVQSIFFSRTRRSVELTLKRIVSENKTGKENIHGYRSGYLRHERSEIEDKLRNGLIRSVISTNALEMGIDMGKVDSIVMMGYPGTVSSFFQQSGRSGRRNRSSVSILIASASPLDQYIIRHDEFIRKGNPESALIDPDNPLILLDHLKCAAFELPFMNNDNFGNMTWENLHPYLEILCSISNLILKKDKYYWIADSYPTSEISLRNINNNPIILRLNDGNSSTIIGEIDFQSAYRFVHPGAVYIHDGNSYLVKKLCEEESYAELVPLMENYITEPRTNNSIKIESITNQLLNEKYNSFFGELQIIEKVSGFKKIDWKTNMLLGYEELQLPERELVTKGVWLTISSAIVDDLRSKHLWGSDSNDYGKEWPGIREFVISRDSSICSVCGLPFKSSELHVHHKIPFRSFSDPKRANQLSNLVSLCQSCHQRVEQNVKIRSGLAGTAFLLANIAPIILMCDYRDIGYFSDPESGFCEKQPVIAVYDQFPGGIGLSAKLFEKLDIVLKHCYIAINECPCLQGCPSCIGPSGENGTSGKDSAKRILKLLTE